MAWAITLSSVAMRRRSAVRSSTNAVASAVDSTSTSRRSTAALQLRTRVVITTCPPLNWGRSLSTSSAACGLSTLSKINSQPGWICSQRSTACRWASSCGSCCSRRSRAAGLQREARLLLIASTLPALTSKTALHRPICRQACSIARRVLPTPPWPIRASGRLFSSSSASSSARPLNNGPMLAKGNVSGLRVRPASTSRSSTKERSTSAASSSWPLNVQPG